MAIPANIKVRRARGINYRRVAGESYFIVLIKVRERLRRMFWAFTAKFSEVSSERIYPRIVSQSIIKTVDC